MAVIRWEPVRELSSLQTEMNRLFGSFFDSPTGAQTDQPIRRWVPPMDLVEAEGEFVLKADLPGLTEADVQIELEDSTLTISGERRTERPERTGGYFRLERAVGAFSRTLTLPDGVDAEAITASFEHGVLEVRIPKPERAKPRKVAIAVGDGSRTTIEGQGRTGEPEAVTA